MHTHTDKAQENTNRSAADAVSQKQNNNSSAVQFEDNRPEAAAQRKLQTAANNTLQAKSVTQFVLDDEALETFYEFSDEQIAGLGLDVAEQKQLGLYKAKKAADAKKAEIWAAALESRVTGKDAVAWDFGGVTYHINVRTVTTHVTKEASPKTHYFFENTGLTISDKQPTKEERGKNSSVFSKLPADVQEFVKNNYFDLIP